MDKQQTPEQDELVYLNTLPGILYAEMVKEALDNNNIPCVIKTDLFSSGLLAKTAGMADDACQIWVYPKHLKKAQNILEGMMNNI